MATPFSNRASSFNGPATDIAPVTPDDATDLPKMAVALYVESGGTVSLISAMGESRTVTVPSFAYLPVGTARVMATGTTASGIHALTVS